ECARKRRIADEYVTVGRIALDRVAGNAHDITAFIHHNRELSPHPRTKQHVRILDTKRSLDRAALHIRQDAKVLEFRLEDAIRHGRNRNARNLPPDETSGEVLWHLRKRVDDREVEDLREISVGAHGLAERDVDDADGPRDRRRQGDRWRRIRELPALNDDSRFAFLDGMVVLEKHLERTSLDPAAHDCAHAGINGDATEREDRFFEISSFGG